jgi:hypothetical protein
MSSLFAEDAALIDDGERGEDRHSDSSVPLEPPELPSIPEEQLDAVRRLEMPDLRRWCSQNVAKPAHIGGRWRTVADFSLRPNYATVYELRRSWTMVEHRLTRLEIRCREIG